MPQHFDALIVGAGPAGCAAAYDLAHAGRRVLLLDRRSFPRPKACACGLTRKTLRLLRYSVEPVLERQCRDVVLQEAGPAFLQGRRVADKTCEVRVHLKQPFCAMAVRERFDHFCLEQTLKAGRDGGSVTLRRVDTLHALREFPDRVELEVTLAGGERATLVAPVLIGADGSNGQTRRLSAGLRASSETPRTASPAELPPEPAWYARGFALEATVPYDRLPAALPAGDHPHDLVFDFAPVAGGYGWLFPKGDHVNIGVGGFVPQKPGAETDTAAAAGDPSMRYETVSRALLAAYAGAKLGVELEALARVPDVHITGQHLGLGGHLYRPEGRVLLSGDAAGLVDPLTGEGIHSALASGQAAAAAVLEAVTAGGAARLASQEQVGSASAEEARAGAVRLAEAYARHLQPLQETLAFSFRAARSFYREPSRGFKVMRAPFLRRLVLKTYADGLPTTKLLASLARRVA